MKQTVRLSSRAEVRLRLSTQDLARDHSRRSDELWIKKALPKGDFFVVDGDLKFLRRPMGPTEETMRFQWTDVDRAEKVTPPIFLGTLPNGRPQFVVEANLMGMERFGLRESIDEFVDGNDVNILAMALFNGIVVQNGAPIVEREQSDSLVATPGNVLAVGPLCFLESILLSLLWCMTVPIDAFWEERLHGSQSVIPPWRDLLKWVSRWKMLFAVKFSRKSVFVWKIFHIMRLNLGHFRDLSCLGFFALPSILAFLHAWIRMNWKMQNGSPGRIF